MSDSSEDVSSFPIITSPGSKRKRTSNPEDLEIDLTLPEPASKKSKRHEKKSSVKQKKAPSKNASSPLALLIPTLANASFSSDLAQSPRSQPATTAQKRSDHSIWIGNLSFKAKKETLREFLRREGGIEEREIVRLHLPTTTTTAPTAAAAAAGEAGKNGGATAKQQQNKGFAYVDFTSAAVAEKALQLSERLMDGRRVLIKDAKSFEGRPVKAADDHSSTQKNGAGGGKSKEPSKRVFVGNLGFDVTREELAEHFRPAGEVEDVFLATFEDSGKCKGFGWVRFKELQAAGWAVKGFVVRDVWDEDVEGGDEREENAEGGEEKGKRKRKRKQREKHFINRLHGRQLRCEFAEDAQTRYKKRFSKRDDAGGAKRRQHADSCVATDNNHSDNADEVGINGTAPHSRIDQSDANGKQRGPASRSKQTTDKEQRREERRKRHEKLDSSRRMGSGLSQRASGVIAPAAGRKVRFEG